MYLPVSISSDSQDGPETDSETPLTCADFCYADTASSSFIALSVADVGY